MRTTIVYVLLLSALLSLAQSNISGARDVTLEIVLTGATTLPLPIRESIVSEINKEANEIGSLDSPQFIDRIRDLFQQQGYFNVSVEDPQWGPIEGVGKQRLVRITVAVHEGSLYKLGG